MKVRTYTSTVLSSLAGVFSVITNWYDLAMLLRIKTYRLSYALKNRRSLQEKIVIEDRVVYESKQPLRYIQERLILLLKPIYALIPTDHILSYMKGKDFRTTLKEKCLDKKMEVTFDIKKCYDHISFRHIVSTLMHFGFSHAGAKLVTRYCVVEREVGGGKINTLQQGSPVSPLLSNLVLYLFIDKPILAWLGDAAGQHPALQYQYLRFSDNVGLWLDGEIPAGFVKAYQTFVIQTLGGCEFKTHKWQFLPHNHPKRNQRFLGIVLNKIARIEKDKFSQLRAILFNMCCKGIEAAVEDYWSEETRERFGVPTAALKGKLLMKMQGHISYVNSISTKQATVMKKLLGAAKMLDEICPEARFTESGELRLPLFDAVKRYQFEIPVDAYLEHLKAVIQAMAQPQALAA